MVESFLLLSDSIVVNILNIDLKLGQLFFIVVDNKTNSSVEDIFTLYKYCYSNKY